LVDFDTNALTFREAGIKVVAASLDSVELTESLAMGMRVGFVKCVGELDGPAVAEATGANLQTGDRVFLHATGLILDPDGNVAEAVYTTGPIGRFTASEVLRKVAFVKFMAAKAAAGLGLGASNRGF
jgi:alkyl hydroperoxide reductase subunit AhpC